MDNQHPIGTIIFDHVSKRYRLGMFGTLRGALGALRPGAHHATDAGHILWALRDVSFEVKPGTAIGLIGPNGAGKTTTLKLLSSITRPASGQILVSGRISSLIELGAGFHPELTGRENIYLNGAILGMKRQEITRKLDDIVAFSELERFIDTPVKRYSSGMYVRLGFAVAAHVQPDILLVDEVLAVGDASFRHKCTQRMHELQRNGTTVVFVSHNMHQVRQTCDTALLLINGQIGARGTADEVIGEYERVLLSSTSEPEAAGRETSGFYAQTGLVLKSVEVTAPNYTANQILRSDQSASVKIAYQCARPQRIGRIDVRILREDGTICSGIDARNASGAKQDFSELAGSGVIEISYDPLQLATGQYTVQVHVTDLSDAMVIASGQSTRFDVYAENSVPNPGIYVPCTHWSHQPDSHQPDGQQSPRFEAGTGREEDRGE